MPPATKLQTPASGIYTVLQSAFPAAFEELTNRDLFVAAAVSATGILVTLALARIYPLGDALVLLGQLS